MDGNSNDSPTVTSSISSAGIRQRRTTTSSSEPSDVPMNSGKTSTSTSQAPGAGASSSTTMPNTQSSENSMFECNICFDQASNPVVSLCGHLYCWPCIHQWMESQEVPLCPVCKAGISKEKVIPVYCRGKEATDPRLNSVPNRPQGQRPAPERPNPTFDPYGPFGPRNFQNVHFSLGFGLFPAVFGFQFNFPEQMRPTGNLGHQNAMRMTPVEEQQAFLSKIFMVIGLFVLFILFRFFWICVAIGSISMAIGSISMGFGSVGSI